ncbi:SOS response-associated peptidase [Planktosalinus lacus]|uniref:Abasic site processing protein n=1 Tax=Planktosalinus lacus TaxID=1526573 RepID=A0A8J2Y5M7_9FLAO|nr:SOS response-associated peptidase family protein [Planktosalinus lacus]GGD86396.1 hypothetical protein GCM10011312_08040 [Planktosalinus lacus]
MCYDISLTKSKKSIENFYKAHDLQFNPPLVYESYFHQRGFWHQNIYIIPQQQPEEIVPATWGLIPPQMYEFIDDYQKRNHNLNARSESLWKVSEWVQCMPKNRCLIIADGFFEPHHRGEEIVPYYCYIPDKDSEDNRKIFVFAGIYTEIPSDAYTASIITVPANSLFEKVHNSANRMPLVLDEEFHQEWLRFDTTKEKLKELMKFGFTKDEFQVHSVNKNLYKNKNPNNPETIKYVEYPSLFDDF